MTMQWLERELRQTGDRQDKLNADLISSMLEHRGKDIPLPIQSQPQETEKPEIQRFSEEQREALKKEGYVVYELTGQSIISLREQDKPIWSIWHKAYPELEALTSRKSEVAINPRKLFLSTSANRTLSEQEELVSRFGQEVSREIPGVRAILGQVPDYLELAFAHLEETGERLFGEKYDYKYTRTQTRVDSFVAGIGDFGADDGLGVRHWSVLSRNDEVFAAPVVVPV